MNDEELDICIENSSPVTVSLEMNIKFGHLLNDDSKLPKIEHYQELLDELDNIELKMETSYSYFV